MLTSFLAVVAIQIVATSARIGVASTSPMGETCVAMPGPPLAAGALITLVQIDSPQSAVVTAIDRAVLSCEVLERALISGPYYLVRQRDATVSGPGKIRVAFAGGVKSRSAGAGRIALRLGERDSNVQVRSCTSSEGVHLTVWAGTPLKSRQLWHEYYYLGYDVDPSCEEGDAPR